MRFFGALARDAGVPSQRAALAGGRVRVLAVAPVAVPADRLVGVGLRLRLGAPDGHELGGQLGHELLLASITAVPLVIPEVKPAACQAAIRIERLYDPDLLPAHLLRHMDVHALTHDLLLSVGP